VESLVDAVPFFPFYLLSTGRLGFFFDERRIVNLQPWPLPSVVPEFSFSLSRARCPCFSFLSALAADRSAIFLEKVFCLGWVVFFFFLGFWFGLGGVFFWVGLFFFFVFFLGWGLGFCCGWGGFWFFFFFLSNHQHRREIGKRVFDAALEVALFVQPEHDHDVLSFPALVPWIGLGLFLPVKCLPYPKKV